KARAHHAAEEAARLQGILDHLAEPFFTVDRDLTITYMNEACARAVGYEPAEAVGRLKCKDVFRSDICETNCAVQRCMRTGEAISGARVTIRNRRGDAIPILATVSTLTDAAGNVVGGYELVRDFTAEALVEGAVREATEQITSATGQVARGITETTQAAEQISVGVQGIAEEMASVSSAASLGTEAAVRGSQAALATVHSMDSVSGAAAEIVEGMRALNVKAEEIGRIIEVIDGVADQTNLLALNAAIEAARAGEHGKGFAVVADEVRKLAERAADATREVNDLLQGIRQLVEQRTHDVETTARAIEESVCQVTDTAQVFDEVAEAIRQTHSSAQSVAATVEQLSASAEEMSASFEEIAASAQELAGMAESLDAAAARLQGAG
ncbi:MAG TPA: methyl-accepting chemotaxis protein, partial [Armatimonadota bacterium]|nr:methyl-accepting chemotaxis protein [Armatimonadota bacterium]